MARVLIVGCGCRGRELGSALQGLGHIVRGTSRSQENLKRVADVGIEPVEADPTRLSQIMEHIEGVAIVVWLMGDAQGDESDISHLHDKVLAHMLRKLVDTQVRGFVYETNGRVSAELLDKGREHVEHANHTWHIPVGFIDQSQDNPSRWHAEALRSINSLLSVG